jgi:hypothetical protein
MKRLAQPHAQRLRSSLGTLAVTALASGTLAAALGSPALAAPAAHRVTYTFETLNNARDLTFNQLLGINNEGLVAGYFGSGAHGHPNKGYRVHPPYRQGSYLSENFPGSRQTQVTGLNDLGVTVGFWSTQNKVSLVNNNFGFYAKGRHFHEVNFPAHGSASPPVDQLLGVNDRDMAVGFYVNAQGLSRGYEYNIKTARFSRVLLPGVPNLSGTVSLTATAINNLGSVAGFYSISGGKTKGFVLTARGHSTKLVFPGASMTQPFGINDLGEVVGAYTLGTGSSATTHGFTWSRNHGFSTVDDPHGIGTTLINGVNDRGVLVGFYTDGAGNTDGMLARPVR